jgi:hypothetical protein
MLPLSEFSALKFNDCYGSKTDEPLRPEDKASPDHLDILLSAMEEYFGEVKNDNYNPKRYSLNSADH